MWMLPSVGKDLCCVGTDGPASWVRWSGCGDAECDRAITAERASIRVRESASKPGEDFVMGSDGLRIAVQETRAREL